MVGERVADRGTGHGSAPLLSRDQVCLTLMTITVSGRHLVPVIRANNACAPRSCANADAACPSLVRDRKSKLFGTNVASLRPAIPTFVLAIVCVFPESCTRGNGITGMR